MHLLLADGFMLVLKMKYHENESHQKVVVIPKGTHSLG